jgi:hypothetical protein
MPGQAVAADVASQGLRGAPRWWVVATSVAGTQHHTRGQPCQDAYYWCTLPDEVLVAAVADGAGSATLGKVGATLAAGTAATTVCSTPQGAGGAPPAAGRGPRRPHAPRAALAGQPATRPGASGSSTPCARRKPALWLKREPVRCPCETWRRP